MNGFQKVAKEVRLLTSEGVEEGKGEEGIVEEEEKKKTKKI